MINELIDGVHWLRHCHELEDGRHIHNSCYLVETDEGNVLIDTGAYTDTEKITNEITSVTDGEGVSSVVITHTDLPHAGSVRDFIDIWDAELVSGTSEPTDFGFPEWGHGLRRCVIGTDMEIDGRTFHIVEPPLGDKNPLTTWIYDSETKVLFTADGYGNFHYSGECNLLFDELREGGSVENIKEMHRAKLPWIRYLDPELFRDALESHIAEYDPSYIASVHGNPIPGNEVATYVDRLVRAVDKCSSKYTLRQNRLHSADP